MENPNIDLSTCKTIECVKCKHIFFTEVKIFKIIPKLLLAAPADVTQPFVVRKCDNCGHVELPKSLLAVLNSNTQGDAKN